MVLSQLPLASILPSGLKATESTTSECPARVRNSLPLATSQNLMVLSQLPLASILPSGLNATELTKSEWPVCTTNRGCCPTSAGQLANRSAMVQKSLPLMVIIVLAFRKSSHGWHLLQFLGLGQASPPENLLAT